MTDSGTASEPIFISQRAYSFIKQMAVKTVEDALVELLTNVDDAYDKQIEGVLKGYCKEWTRICATKAHGHLAENAAALTAMKIFFGALTRDAGTQVYGYFEGIGVC